MNQITQSLQQTRGDTVTHTIQTTWDGALYDPSTAGLVQDAIFSLKALATDSDEDAIFQKALGFGIELASNAITLAVLPSDTREIEDVSKRFVWDVRVLETDGDRKTVATGTLLLFANITRDLDLTLAVTTTNAPDINRVTETMLNEAIAAAIADLVTETAMGTAISDAIGAINFNEIVDAILVGHGLIPAPE